MRKDGKGEERILVDKCLSKKEKRKKREKKKNQSLSENP